MQVTSSRDSGPPVTSDPTIVPCEHPDSQPAVFMEGLAVVRWAELV